MAISRHLQPAIRLSLIPIISLILTSTLISCQTDSQPSTTNESDEASNKSSEEEVESSDSNSTDNDSQVTPENSDSSPPSQLPSNDDTDEGSEASDPSLEESSDDSQTETEESGSEGEESSSESTDEEDDSDSGETGEKMGMDDKPACAVFSSMEVEEIAAAEVESEATQVVVLPSTEKAYRIKLPESKIGYVTYEIEDWDSVQAFYTSEGTEYSLWVVDGKTEMPKTKAMSCPDSPITEQLVHLKHWTPVRVEFAAEGPREVWFMAYLSDRQQS